MSDEFGCAFTEKAINKHGYEWATRQAWKCGIKANLVKRVIGIFKGQIVCVVEGCRAELSTPINNPLHDDEKQVPLRFRGWHLLGAKQRHCSRFS